MDESNQRIDTDRVVEQIRAGGAGGLVALTGVQTNQFPRAMDLARIFREADIQVGIGGFHVSGCVAMLQHLLKELLEAQEIGIGLFAGEAEDGRLDEVIRDAFAGLLKSLYNHVASQPSLEGQPRDLVERTYNSDSSFDLGRGCPFSCSFCNIINVQGKKSRYRSADDLEQIVRENHAQGINRFFLTDDKLARNTNWEACLDRLIALRDEGLPVRLIARVDVKCHKIRGFVDKAVKAGVDQLFIGLEIVLYVRTHDHHAQAHGGAGQQQDADDDQPPDVASRFPEISQHPPVGGWAVPALSAERPEAGPAQGRMARFRAFLDPGSAFWRRCA